jgi:prophage regulatory protein
MQKNQISPQYILRLKAVIERTGISRSNIYSQIKAGTFPAPISLGARAIGFINHEIDAWIESRVKISRESSMVPL